jgi:hypothetical protein
VLGISRATADRYWAYSRVWLYSELSDGEAGPRDSEPNRPNDPCGALRAEFALTYSGRPAWC